jgi:hypothetical protein
MEQAIAVKECKNCNILKSLDLFSKRGNKCKDCYKSDSRKRTEKYRDNKKNSKLITNTKVCKKCLIEKDNSEYKGRRVCISCFNEDRLFRYYKKENREPKIKDDDWYKTKQLRSYQKSYECHKKRLKEDLVYKLSKYTGTFIRGSLKRCNYTKKSRTYEILGCSYEEFKLYLESKFEYWMTWENQEKYNGELNFGWDIDHIEPLFPEGIERTEEDIIRLNHYTNLRPLCSKVNRDIKKNNHMENILL